MILLEAETAYAIVLSRLEGEGGGPACDEDLALLLHIACSCLGFGLYELTHDSRWFGYRWVPGAAAALAGA